MVDQDSREGPVSSDAWYWYGKSKLAFWLRYDTWPAELGLCLICDIDPERGEELTIDDVVDGVDIMPGDKFPHRVFKSVCLLSEDPIYKLEPVRKPGRYALSVAKQYLDEIADWLDNEIVDETDDIKPEYIKPNYSDICDRLRLRHAACKKRNECWILFESNPAHLEQETFAPSYFIDWAASKGFDIPWLKWAVQDNLVKARKTKALAVSDVPEKASESDKRREEGLSAAITILGDKHAGGALSDWQDFEKCMRKAVVIDYIRKNPTVFPHCAKTKPILDKNEGQSIKDREPTLTKSFPDFTKTTEIVDEYERLTREK